MITIGRACRRVARQDRGAVVMLAQFESGPAGISGCIAGKLSAGKCEGQTLEEKRIDQNACGHSPPKALWFPHQAEHHSPR